MSGVIGSLTHALEGRYRIERQLGEGGMATVYLAEDLRHERKVALKVLKPELTAVVGAERFLAEIKTTAKLQHPHILPLFDSGEADGFLFYVMPYVVGETLRERLDREKQLGVEEALAITRKVADALDYAHESSVVHRDIKPANILLSERGEPLVADFGIALAVAHAGSGRLTETGLSLGTPHYMSPEQATGDRDVDPRSDLYALGCVLYEMLAGEPPFSAGTAQAILAKILTMDAPSITMVRRTVPPNVGAALAKSLEKLPADRFTSVADFAAALEDEGFTYRARTRTSTSAVFPEAAAAVRPGPWNRVSVTMTAVAAVAATAAAWGWLRPAPVASVQPATRAVLDLDVEGAALLSNSRVVISPRGDRLAVVLSVGGSSQIWWRPVEEDRFRLLLDEGNPRDPDFSPDGNWLVYGDAGALTRIAIAGGARRPLMPAQPSEVVTGPAWGEDGRIYFSGRSGGLFAVPETGGEPTELVPGVWSRPDPLPGGRGVLVSDSTDTYVYDLAADSLRLVISNGVAPTWVGTGHVLYLDRDRGLWAQPFDLATADVSGEAVPVLADVSLSAGRWAQVDVAGNGTLVYGVGEVTGSHGLAGELLIVHLDGAEQALPLAPRVFNRPRWSPDGEWIAYTGTPGPENARWDLYTYNVVTRSQPRQLTFEGTGSHHPIWSPDGARIAFATTASGERDLFIKTPAQETPRSRLWAREGAETPSEWLAGDVLVWSWSETLQDQSESDIWIGEIGDSATMRPWVDQEGRQANAAVAPTGDLAAYESDDSGITEVYVRAFPDAREPTRVSNGGGASPRWSPDGTTIYYWRGGGPQSVFLSNAYELFERPDSLFAARVVREPRFAVRSTEFVLAGRPGWSTADWDLHPDGDRFVIRQLLGAEQGTGGEGAPADPHRYLIVTNWFTELLATMGREGAAR